jgi:BirA family biotin operon repressor/biotin-[acetyl-CoA-carboxylase] ligase
LAQQAASNSIGSPFIELQTVDSTNKYAMELIHAGMAQHGTAVFAHKQTAGKGQRNKHWISEPGVNIQLSLIIKPELLQIHEQFYLSAAVALAVRHFFSKYAGDETKIKWPNDLYWRDRKAGGILIESVIGSSRPVNNSGGSLHSARNKWQWAVIGIGININQTKFPDDLPNPVSLKQITGRDFDVLSLTKDLCASINEHLNLLLAGKKKEFIEDYNVHLYKRNEKVKLKKGSRVFDVVVKSVSSTGKLVTVHAIDEEFDFGEAEWLIEKDK